MTSADANPCCNDELQPPAERARTDSWVPPLDDNLLKRRNVALVAAAVCEAVAPLVGQQLEQLESSMRKLLIEHTAQLSRVEATLQSVEHTVVSRCHLRGSLKPGSKLADPTPAAGRIAARSPAPTASTGLPDDGGLPKGVRSRTPSKGSSAGSPDSNAQAGRSHNSEKQPPPVHRWSEHLQRHTERNSTKEDRRNPRSFLRSSSPNASQVMKARSANVSPAPSKNASEGTRTESFPDALPPLQPNWRRRRVSSPADPSKFLLATAESAVQRVSVHELPPVAPAGKPEEERPKESKGSDALDHGTAQVQPSQGVNLPQQPDSPQHRERRPSGELNFRHCLSDPGISVAVPNEVNGHANSPSSAQDVAEQLAGAAAALAALPAQEETGIAERSLEVRVSQTEAMAPSDAETSNTNTESFPSWPQAGKPSPLNTMRRAKSDTFQCKKAKVMSRVSSKDGAAEPKSPMLRKKNMRRQKSEADAFRARFATEPAAGSTDNVDGAGKEEAERQSPSPARSRRASLSTDRSSRNNSSKSPDRMHDFQDSTSPPAKAHFDLYSLEHLHSARLLELEVEDGGYPWCAVGSMLPMRQERQDSPVGRMDSYQAQAATKVVPEPDEIHHAKGGSASLSSRFLLQRQATAPESIASSGSEFSEAFAVHDVKASTRNLDDLRRRHDHKLTSSELHHDDETFMVTSPENSDCGEGYMVEEEERDKALQWKTRIALCICGVVPFQLHGRASSLKLKASTWYQNMVLLIAALSAAFTLIQGLLGKGLLAEDRQDDRDPHRSLEWRWYLGSLPFAVGSVMGLLIMRAGRVQKLVRSFPGPLEAYAYRHGFVDVWSHHASRRLTVLVSFWAMIVLVRLCGDVLLLKGIDYTAWDNLMLLLSFIISSSIFLALIVVQLYIFSILGMMVDQFCFKFFECPDVSQGIQEWNVIQAILRHVTSAFDTCFLATQTSALVALLLSATQLLQIDLNGGTRETIGYIAGVFLPPVLMACAAGSLFFIAAEVTEKCSRVPALLNSVMCGGEDMLQHEKRHCIVQYVTYSAAGFYMKEVRLTASMALKLTYITALGAYFVLTKIATDTSTTML